MRALRILSEVDIIVAEDTRVTKKLLKKYEIKAVLESYSNKDIKFKTVKLLRYLVNHDLALVTDAGTPAISDPGKDLVDQAILNGFKVVPIPGPSSVIASASISGLDLSNFLYLGFLPNRSIARRKALLSVANSTYPLIIFESPHRLKTCLVDMKEVLGDRLIVICRELTKMYEEIFRGKITEAQDRFVNPIGEFTIIVQTEVNELIKNIDQGTLDLTEELMVKLKSKGFTTKDVIPKLAKLTNISKKILYSKWSDLRKYDD
jgi:16S rRNA (cytidine1402-2'-O)-methyltransferase